MGLPKHAAGARAVVTCNDLRNWARANLDREIERRPSYPPRISFAVVQKFNSHALFLVAARDKGKNVLEAACVVFALVNGSGGRVSQVARTARIVRPGGDEDEIEWREALAASLKRIEVDPSLLDRLSTSIGKAETC